MGSLAFDGATKRNRPNLQIGSLVYARVSKTRSDLEPELTCEGREEFDGRRRPRTNANCLLQAPSSIAKKDWMTGLAIYGELTGGYVFQTSMALAKSLLREDCPVLASLGKSIAFEVAVGMNGTVWVNAKSTKNITIISNAILNSETMTPGEVDAMVTRLVQEADEA